MSKKTYTLSSKMGRTALRNNTNKFVTHLLYNEKWLMDQISTSMELVDRAKLEQNPKLYLEAMEACKDLVAQHRLFVAELLPYCMPKLSAVMGSDSEEAVGLLRELMELGKQTDSAINAEEKPEA